ncbi:hypothetical protein ABBQ38_012762 [Trebouxia sp. C0009 RCD-2024]
MTPSVDAKKQTRQRLAKARKHASRPHKTGCQNGSSFLSRLTQEASSAWCGCLKAFGLTLCSADFGMPYLCQQSGVGMELLIPDVYVVLGVIMSMLGVVLTRLRHQKAKGPLSYITQQGGSACYGRTAAISFMLWLYLCRQPEAGTGLFVSFACQPTMISCGMLGIFVTRLRHQKAKVDLSHVTQQAGRAWSGCAAAITFMLWGYVGQQTEAHAELLVCVASTLSAFILSTLGCCMSRLVGPVLPVFRPCQASRVSIWAAQLRGLKLTYPTTDSRQKQLDEQHTMAGALAAAQAALQAALHQQQEQDRLAASTAHNAQAEKLSRLSSSNSDLLKHLQFLSRCMDCSDAFIERLKHHIEMEEEFMESCLACLEYSQEQLAAAATREGDLKWQLAAALKLEHTCAAKVRCLRTSEAFAVHYQDRLAELQQKLEEQTLQTQQAQQEVQTLVSEMQPLQEAHDWAHQVHSDAALPSLPQRPPTHLGQGTFGSVHAAYSPAMGHYVVKSPTQHATASAMDEEAHFLNLFRHPHVVQYLGRVQDSAGGAVPGILMEKLDMDLYDYMQLPNIFDTAEAVLNFAVQLAAGVNAFHVRGYVHGDLKPNNIGCCVLKSVVKVMDLGMVTQAGTLYVYGTGDLPFHVQYCPPELVDLQRGGTKILELTTAMEVFVYGLVLAEVAGFDRPCDKRDPLYEEALVSMQNAESWVQFPLTHSYPMTLLDVVADCLKRDPALRPSMPDVLHRLGALLP